MKKTLRKMTALFLSVCMIMAMGLTAFAEETTTTKPTANDKTTVTVSNVESGMTVTAYQITKAKYNDNGFVEYEKANSSLTIADVLAPTSDEVTAIAKNTTGLTSKTLTYADNVYSAVLEPGYWVVVVTGTGTGDNATKPAKVYNPMLAGVYYSVSGNDNTMVGGTIDAKTNWGLATIDAYAKSSEVTTTKTIVDSGSKNDHGDDVAIGDTVKFQISSTIPSYSKEYTHATYVIHDEISEGLTYVQKAGTYTVTVDNVAVDGADVKFDGQQMKVTIPSIFVLERDDDGKLVNAGKSVIVTYQATLNENAGINFDANTNTAKTEYTNDPSETNDATKKTTETPEDKTYHYTFGIDASLGSTVTNTETTKELYKVAGKDGKVEVNKETKEVTVTSPLAGATFKLTNNTTKKVYTAISDDNGAISFTGLDAGTYTLEETVAPDGYSLEGKTHTVDISATYVATGDDKGKLQSYTITIDGKSTSTYTATYEKEGTNTTTTVDKTAIGSVGIQNTTISSLPSTGGIGTYIFTIVGVVIMVVAGSMFFVSRKKRA